MRVLSTEVGYMGERMSFLVRVCGENRAQDGALANNNAEGNREGHPL